MIPSLELRNINGWDSMKHLQLILTIERELSLTLSPDEIESIITVGDLEQFAVSCGLA